jgi:hypothetical protein
VTLPQHQHQVNDLSVEVTPREYLSLATGKAKTFYQRKWATLNSGTVRVRPVQVRIFTVKDGHIMNQHQVSLRDDPTQREDGDFRHQPRAALRAHDCRTSSPAVPADQFTALRHARRPLREPGKAWL